jgi:hypothetical protein
MRLHDEESELCWVGLCPNHHLFGFPPLACHSSRILPDRPRPVSVSLRHPEQGETGHDDRV